MGGYAEERTSYEVKVGNGDGGKCRIERCTLWLREEPMVKGGVLGMCVCTYYYYYCVAR